MRLQAFGFCAAFTFCAAIALADDTYDLSLHPTEGSKWECSQDVGVRIRTTENFAGTLSTPGITETKRKFTTTVAEVSNGKWTKLELAFDKCDTKNQLAGAPTAEDVNDPLSQKTLTLTRHVDAGAAQNKIDIDEHGNALTVTLEDDLQANYSTEIMPAKPVKVGQYWTSDKVGALLGGDLEGRADCHFDRVETAKDGRKFAVVSVTGHYIQKIGSGPAAQNVTDTTVPMTITVNFKGIIDIDLASGMFLKSFFDGPVDVELGGGGGQSVREHGELIYNVRYTPQMPAATSPASPAGADNHPKPRNPLGE